MGLSLRRLWVALAGLCAAAQIVMAASTQAGQASTLMSLLVWAGAWLCLEEVLPGLELRPSRLSGVLGSLLVAAALWRLSLILHLDGAALILPFWLGLGLALLCRPPRQLLAWRSALIVLALPPLASLLERSLPQPLLASLTGRTCQVLLLLLGIDASSQGNHLWLAGGGVEIVSECTGVLLITQMAVVAVILLLAFPLPRLHWGGIALVSAVLIAFAVNVGRITLLALIHASRWPQRQWWFDFFHKDAGSLIFAAVAASLLGWLYLALMQAACPGQRHG